MTVLDDFIVSTDELVIFQTNCQDIILSDQTESSLEAFKIELNNLWLRVKACYALCIQGIANGGGEAGNEDYSETLKGKYRSSSNTYIYCLAEIIETIKKLKIIKNDSSSPSSHLVSSSGPCIKVPVCDSQTFSGDYLTWPSFRDMFTAVYVKHPKLCPVQKLFHLRSKTTGNALNIVSKFPLTDDNFELAWAALADQYENKRILVNNQLKTLFNLPFITGESSKQIKDIQREINDALSNLKINKIFTETWDPILVYLCSSRLPEFTLSLWEQSVKKPSEIPTWKDMDSFLNNRYRVLETVSDIKLVAKLNPSSSSKTTKPIQTKKQNHKAFHMKPNTFPQCKLCKGYHHLRFCSKFTKMSIEERSSTVKSLNYCSNCLSGTHLAPKCLSKYSCMPCFQRHHTLLHNNNSTTSTHNSASSTNNSSNNKSNSVSPLSEVFHPSSSFQQNPTPSIQSTANPVKIQTYVSRHNNKILLATALVDVYHLGDRFTLRALIDPASEVTFLTERIQKSLNLPVKSVQASISGVSDVVTATSSKICSLVLCSKYDHKTISATAYVLKRLTGDLPSCEVQPTEIGPVDFHLADPFFYESSSIDLVLGVDLYPLIIREGIRNQVFGSLLGQNTIFGWILSGPLQSTDLKCFSTILSGLIEVSLDQQISEFWRVEEVPDSKHLSASEQYCEDFYSATTSRDSKGRYVVKLPFKQPTPILGRSRDIALKQFQSEYNNVLQEYINLQHMHRVTPNDLYRDRQMCSFYLPHHAVLKPDSISTKLRVVFNASNSTSNGTSLNDILYPGPVLQSDLMTLILRWRFFRYVFNADIEKMYRQIKVHPEHTAFQRILFRNSNDDAIMDYELNTVTFGVNCAPYLALRTLKRLADDVKESFPLASSVLQTDFYVDDVLSGAHDIETALRTQSELISALRSAGFTLRKWTANSTHLIAHFPLTDLYNQELLKFEDKSFTKTLGIQWNAQTDSFHFFVQRFDFETTKRAVLSIIARLFDPAGWLSPVIVTAKIIMQQVWKDGTSWDRSIMPLTCHRWKIFFDTLNEIESIQIPRWIQYSPYSTSIQIHGFCDASESAYAATLYCRTQNDIHSWSSHLLCAKSKVAPVKSLSLPRLELCGTLLLSNLVSKVLPQLNCKNFQLFLWTDSSIVLCWLEKPPSTWATFVGNRVSLIQESTSNATWMHVRSADNPADLATRGLTPMQLKESSLWWSGPSWLSQAEQFWPRSLFSCPNEQDLEKRPIKVNHTNVSVFNIENIIKKFSSLPKALNIVAYILRFFHRTHPKYRSEFKYKSKDLTYEENCRSKNLILRLTQSMYYPAEYSVLSKGEQIPVRSSLANLNPLLDSNKILRVNGRLVHSSLSYNERYPVILPYHAHITTLIVQFIHKVSLHGENLLVLRLTRCEYWIPRLKNLVKKLIRLRKVCTIHRQEMRQQIMAALPPERTQISLPFINTGLDFAGPFTLKTFSGQKCHLSKGYVCLFVCFSTQAIHLEATSDLSSQSFLAALSRFIARRGTPKTIFSDNGKNLVDASKIIENSLKTFKRSLPSIACELYNDRKLEWKFIPPGAPHMGGLWESGVKSFKKHFRKITADHKYTFEEFSTLLAKIEACLNSRPISPMSDNSVDILPLTPGHFLRGGPLLAPPEPDLTDASINCINRWTKLQILHQQFCVRWKNEYLLELQKRHKWKHPKENVKENDLVVIKNENLPPNEWRLGRVIRVYPGIDNRVRVADVKTQYGVVTRPIVKLCVLTTD